MTSPSNPFRWLEDPEQFKKEVKNAIQNIRLAGQVHSFAEAEERHRQEEREAQRAARQAVRDAARSQRLDRPSVEPAKPPAKRGGSTQRGKLKTKAYRALPNPPNHGNKSGVNDVAISVITPARQTGRTKVQS